MTAKTTRRPLTGALMALVLIVFGAPWTSQVVSAKSRSFFVSFTDADGVPVTDLTRQGDRNSAPSTEGASDQPAIRVLTTHTGVYMAPTCDGNVP